MFWNGGGCCFFAFVRPPPKTVCPRLCAPACHCCPAPTPFDPIYSLLPPFTHPALITIPKHGLSVVHSLILTCRRTNCSSWAPVWGGGGLFLSEALSQEERPVTLHGGDKVRGSGVEGERGRWRTTHRIGSPGAHGPSQQGAIACLIFGIILWEDSFLVEWEFISGGSTRMASNAEAAKPVIMNEEELKRKQREKLKKLQATGGNPRPARTLFLFGLKNPFRKACINIVEWKYPFILPTQTHSDICWGLILTLPITTTCLTITLTTTLTWLYCIQWFT